MRNPYPLGRSVACRLRRECGDDVETLGDLVGPGERMKWCRERVEEYHPELTRDECSYVARWVFRILWGDE